MGSAKPLQPLQGFTGLSNLNVDTSAIVSFNGQSSRTTFHVFVNATDEPVYLYWFHDASHLEQLRGKVEPGSNLYVGTYTFHQWKVKSESGKLLGVHSGQSAIVTIKPQGCTIAFNHSTADADASGTCIETEQGKFSIRSHVLGIPVWAFDCVAEAAVECAVRVATRMLENCPPNILQSMLLHKPSLAIFGKHQVLTDVPAHQFMKYNTGRDLDKTARGLGATPTVPVTSCAEENLLMQDDKLYPCQSILVHELGHCIQNLGMDLHLRSQVQAAYTAAVSEKLYPHACYMTINEHEYWAVGTEAWFESTIRTDVTGGMNTRAKLKSHDPRLASVMVQVYGDGDWRYHHDCPCPLSFYSKASHRKSHEQQVPLRHPSQSVPVAGISQHEVLHSCETPRYEAVGSKRSISRQHSRGRLVTKENSLLQAPVSEDLPPARSVPHASNEYIAALSPNQACQGLAGSGLPSQPSVPVSEQHKEDSHEFGNHGEQNATWASTISDAFCLAGALNMFCPGIRMYPADHPEDVTDENAQSMEADSSRKLERRQSTLRGEHSSQIISILSGGASQNPTELAEASSVPAPEELESAALLWSQLPAYVLPFGLGSARDSKKVKHSV